MTGKIPDCFRLAKAAAKSADQALAEAYANALRPRQNVYSRTLEDSMSPPIVKRINTRDYKGAAGDWIVSQAADDFRVTRGRKHMQRWYAAGSR